jgi:cobalt-zinc-cadmium efflux system outer membrane protein
MNRPMLAAALLLSLSSTVWAQRIMSFEELAQAALNNNRELQAARESLKQAEARLTQAHLRPNPTLDVSGSTDALFSGEGDNTLSVIVSQPLELGGKRAKRVNIEQLSVDLAKARIAESERQLRGRLSVLFVEALSASSRLEMFDRIEKLNQQTVRVMDVRLRSGDASRLDSQLLLAQTNQTRAQRLATTNHLDAAILQIQTLAGLTQTGPLTLQPNRTAEFTSSEQAAIAQALENRPDMRAARLREAMEEAGVVLAKSQAIPNASISVGYGRESIPIVAAGSQLRAFEQDNVMQFGISIPLPFFNREQGNIAEAASRQGQARLEREALEIDIRREVALAYRRYATAHQMMDMLQTGVVQPNQDSSRIVQLAYSLGELRLLDVISQERIAVEAETSYIEAQNEYDKALAELHVAIGY